MAWCVDSVHKIEFIIFQRASCSFSLGVSQKVDLNFEAQQFEDWPLSVVRKQKGSSQ